MVDGYNLGTSSYISYLAWHIFLLWEAVPDQMAMFQANHTSMLSVIILVACLDLEKLLKAIHTKVKCELPPALKMQIDWSPFEDTCHIAFAAVDWISLFFGEGIEFDINNRKRIGWLLLANTTGVNGSWGVGSDETQDPLPPEPAYIISMANTTRLCRHIIKDAISDILWVDRRRIEPQFRGPPSAPVSLVEYAFILRDWSVFRHPLWQIE